MAEFTYDAAPRPRTPALDGLITAILGGTGEQGRGLARRFAMAGHPVIIGSRSRNRARATAQAVGHCCLTPRRRPLDQDVLVLGDDRAATGLVRCVSARRWRRSAR